MELFGLLTVGFPGGTFQNVMSPGRRFTPVFVNGLKTASLIIFRALSLEAELTELSIDASIVQAHQHSAGAKKGAIKRKLDTAVVESQQFLLEKALSLIVIAIGGFTKRDI